jgi:hypothetical protein
MSKNVQKAEELTCLSTNICGATVIPDLDFYGWNLPLDLRGSKGSGSGGFITKEFTPTITYVL